MAYKSYQEEKAERAERIALLKIEAAVVVSELGGSWAIEPAKAEDVRDHVMLRDADGRRVELCVPQYNYTGKVEVSGWFDYGPTHLGISFPYGKTRPQISVSLSRGGAVIAKEIKRRFLPAYDELFHSIGESVRKATNYRDTQMGITARLAALAGAEPKRTQERSFCLITDNYTRTVEVNVSNSTVDLKLFNLSESQAAEILRLLAPHFAARKEG
jgi:hypothetical protein